jgi:toxin FitB
VREAANPSANIVDSSGWLEFFAGGKNAAAFEPPLDDVDSLIIPAVTIYEVFKVLFREAGEEAALQGVAAMQQGRVVDLTPQRALAAAGVSLRHSLPMADSMIVAAAEEYGATIWTQDEDFERLPNVRFFRKKK